MLKRFEMTDNKTLFIFMNENFSNIITLFDNEYWVDADTVY